MESSDIELMGAEESVSGMTESEIMCHYDGHEHVPEHVTHVTVDPSITVIPSAEFRYCSYLTAVELPDGLKTIGESAFLFCKTLKSIDIPSTVTEIDARAFQFCRSLRDISLPEGLLELGMRAFFGCSHLKTIHIPPMVQIIELGTFLGCSDLTEVILPMSLEQIKESAFEGCNSLVSIDFPSSLRVVEKSAFHRTGLTKFNLPDSVEEFGAFSNCKFTNIRLSKNITKFDTGIFVDVEAQNIISIELPESVEQVVYPHLKEKNLVNPVSLLRNIAFPVGYTGDKSDAVSRYVHSKWQHRFDGLPIHKLCYYHSYHDAGQNINDLKRIIHPWSTKTRSGKVNDTGKRPDSVGMTPLHILACSTKHNLELYQLLVEKYPGTLIATDDWEYTPLLYAFLCNAPSEVIAFLVESYKTKYPGHDLQWGCMVHQLYCLRAPLGRLQILMNSHERFFPDEKIECIEGTMLYLAQQMDKEEVEIVDESYRFLLRASVAKRLESLNVQQWRSTLENYSDRLRLDRGTLGEKVRAFYVVLRMAERQKVVASLLELALWKAALVDHVQKKPWIDSDISHRMYCRVNCGAEIVIRNVLPFLWIDYEV